MEPRQFFTASRIIIVAGKGGVGKTTVAATLGVCAATAGIDTLLVEVEGKRGLGTLFGEPGLTYDGATLIDADAEVGRARLRARTIAADDALVDYFADHGLGRFGKTLTRMQVLDTLATSTPGLRDLIVMGKIKQLESANDAELIVVDAPASGHAISFLRAARGLQQSVDTGPIRRQADEVAAMLSDPARSQVMLVTLPEETPVNELVETAYALEDEVGISLAPLVVNGVLGQRDVSSNPSRSKAIAPEMAAAAAKAADHWSRRAEAQTIQAERLGGELPLEQLVLPRLATTAVGRHDLDALALHLRDEIDALQFEGSP